MPLSIYSSSWRTAKNVYVRASNAWQNVKQVYVYANGAWRQVFTTTKPAARINIWDPSGDINVLVNSSRTIKARLEDEDGNQVSEVRNIVWSEDGPGALSSVPTQTRSDGSASVTYSVENTTGVNTIKVTSTGLIEDSVKITVKLEDARVPDLEASPFNEGYYLAHKNPNSSWSYSVELDPSNTATYAGNINSTNPGIVRIPPRNDSKPVISTTSSLTYVECTRPSGGWTFRPTVKTTVTSTRSGYEDGVASVSASPTGNTVFLYQFQYSNNSGSSWTNWGDPINEDTVNLRVRKNKGADYNNFIRNNKLRCAVTATRSGGSGGGQAVSTTAFSDTIIAP